MKLSSKSRYGLNAMYHLAKNNDNCTSLTELSRQTNISQPFLEKVLADLRKNGLVNATRGSQGGYVLSRLPKEITVGQILRTFEKDLIVINCSGKSDCTNFNCPSKGIYKVIYERVNNVLDDITLQDMIENKGDIL